MRNALEPKGEKRAVFPIQERAPIDSLYHLNIRQALMASKIPIPNINLLSAPDPETSGQ